MTDYSVLLLSLCCFVQSFNRVVWCGYVGDWWWMCWKVIIDCITQYYYCHYVVLSNHSIVWSGLDMWVTGGGCVGNLPLITDNREFVMSLSLSSLSHTCSNEYRSGFFVYERYCSPNRSHNVRLCLQLGHMSDDEVYNSL